MWLNVLLSLPLKPHMDIVFVYLFLLIENIFFWFFSKWHFPSNQTFSLQILITATKKKKHLGVISVAIETGNFWVWACEQPWAESPYCHLIIIVIPTRREHSMSLISKLTLKFSNVAVHIIHFGGISESVCSDSWL